LNENFRGKGASPTNDFWHQKSRVRELSYGDKKLPKISTGWVGRTNVTDRQTDRQQTTDRIATAISEREREFTSAKKGYSASHWHSDDVMVGNITFLWFLHFLSPRTRGNMFSPELVCVCVYVCVPVCLSVTTITKTIVDGFVPNFCEGS